MRKKLIRLVLFACVSGSLSIPAMSLGQQREGDLTQQGDKGGKTGQPGDKGGNGQLSIGGMNIDVNAIFDQISNEQNSILISNAGPLRKSLQQWARENGNTSGSVSRQQFYGFMQANVPGQQAGKGGAAKGQGAKGGDPDAAIAQRFKGVDKNGDGFISNDEMSAQAKETGVWKQFDVDGDTRLNLEEYKVFSREKAAAEQALKMAGAAKGTAGLYAAMTGKKTDNVVRVEKVIDTEWEKRPVVFRPSKLPPGLPKWFAELDMDRDAQIGLYEWKLSPDPLQKFHQMDRNNDCLLTADEVFWYMNLIAGTNSQSSTIASFSPRVEDKKGFQFGGLGGFNNKGNGGGMKGGFGGGFGGGGGGGKKGKKGSGEY